MHTCTTHIRVARRFSPCLWMAVILTILSLASCSTHRRSTGPAGAGRGDSAPVNAEFMHLSRSRRMLIEEAQTWIGTPYKYACAEKYAGADCSGMVLRVYLDVLGIKLPRNSAQQADFCKPMKLREILPGDLVFFATGKDTSKVSHVGIMLDYENFIHMSTSKGAVISKITTPYYTSRFMGFGRVPGV